MTTDEKIRTLLNEPEVQRMLFEFVKFFYMNGVLDSKDETLKRFEKLHKVLEEGKDEL